MSDQSYATTEAPMFGNSTKDPFLRANGPSLGASGPLGVVEEPEPGALPASGDGSTPNVYPPDSDPNSFEEPASFPPESFPNSATQFAQQPYTGVCISRSIL